MEDEATAQVDYENLTFEQFHTEIGNLVTDQELIKRVYHSTNETPALITQLDEIIDMGDAEYAHHLIKRVKSYLGKTAKHENEFARLSIKIYNFLKGHRNHFDTKLHRLETKLTNLEMNRMQEDIESQTHHRNTSFEEEDVFSMNSNHVIREQESQELDTDLEHLETELPARAVSTGTPERALDNAVSEHQQTIQPLRSYSEDLESEIENLRKRLHQSDKQNRKLNKRNRKLNKRDRKLKVEINEWKEEVSDRNRTIRILQERQRSHGITNTQRTSPGNPPTDRTLSEYREPSRRFNIRNGNQQQVRPASSPMNPSGTHQLPNSQDPNQTRPRNSTTTNKRAKNVTSDRAPKPVTDETPYETTEVLDLLEQGRRQLPEELHAALEHFRTEKGMKSLRMIPRGENRCAVARLYRSYDVMGSDENETCWYCRKYSMLCIKATPYDQRTPLALPAELRQGLSPRDEGYWKLPNR